jgi:hypothetical protein
MGADRYSSQGAAEGNREIFHHGARGARRKRGGSTAEDIPVIIKDPALNSAESLSEY